MNEEQKKILLEKSGFKCQKCGYYSPLAKNLVVLPEHYSVLCSICSKFAPVDKEEFKAYLLEKINGEMLESFRKFSSKSNIDNQKKGMIKSAKQGKIVSRPAFGYKIENSLLIPAENADEVREIFESFSEGASLNSLAKLHNLSVNGVKKILKNFTYIGKIKFDNQILQGNHKPIIFPELFNRVQKRFDELSE